MSEEKLLHRFIAYKQHRSESENNMLSALMCKKVPAAECELLMESLSKNFGTLLNTLEPNTDSLMMALGDNKASALICLCKELYFRTIRPSVNESCVFDSFENISKYFIRQFTGEEREILCLAYLDSHMNLLSLQKYSSMDRHSVEIDIRGIMKNRLAAKARKVVISHNHISTSAKPSEQDYVFTNNVSKTLAQASLQLVEHITVYRKTAYGILTKRSFEFE